MYVYVYMDRCVCMYSCMYILPQYLLLLLLLMELLFYLLFFIILMLLVLIILPARQGEFCSFVEKKK
jgi:hypothetical protein